ncbi:hypothetical protein IAT38_006752 [Cryptococcus sp. DSM 104549]
MARGGWGEKGSEERRVPERHVRPRTPPSHRVQPLPTLLGIHRLYTAPFYPSHGLSLHFLEAAREYTVYDCSFDPSKGDAAFSRATWSEQAVV